MKFTKTHFSCKRDDLTIRGIEFRPAGEQLPIAIISHGFMANMRSTTDYAKQLAYWGYASYVFDFNGGCLRGKSDGKTTDMSVLTEVEDLKAVISYVKALPYTDEKRLLLMGCSQGGFVSALTAAELGPEIEKLILFYPALCIPDDARKGQMMMAKFDPQNPPKLIKCGPMKLGACYPNAVKEMGPFEEISQYKGKVLIIHGNQDKIVNVSYSQQAKEAYLSARGGDDAGVYLTILDGAGHGFKKAEDKTALMIVRDFLHNRLKNAAAEVLTGRT